MRSHHAETCNNNCTEETLAGSMPGCETDENRIFLEFKTHVNNPLE